jgi:hypothetical protein
MPVLRIVVGLGGTQIIRDGHFGDHGELLPSR